MTRKRKMLLVAGIPACLLLGLTLVLLFFAATGPGLATLVWLAQKLGGGTLALESGQGRLASDFTLKRLRIMAEGTELELGELRLSWQPGALLRWELPIRSLEVRGLTLHLAEDPAGAGEEGADPVQLPEFRLPFALLADRVLVEDLHIYSGQNEVFALKTAGLQDLQGRERRLSFAAFSAKDAWLDLQARGQVEMSGNWPLGLDCDYAFTFTGFAPIRGRGEFRGDLARLAVQTELRQPQRLSLKGELRELLNDLHWEALASSPGLALDKIAEDWPEQRFSAVEIHGQGSLERYELEVGGQVVSAMFRRPLALHSTLEIGLDGLSVRRLELADAKGRLQLSGTLDWSPHLAWNAAFTAADLNPDIVLEQLDGGLSGGLAAKGVYRDGKVTAELRLDNLHGRLHGYPLKAEGQAAYREGRLDLQNLRAALGGSELVAHGSCAGTCALEARLHAPDLRAVLPELAGSLEALLKLHGPADSPLLELELAGGALDFGGRRLERLEATARGELSAAGTVQAQVRAGGFMAGDLHIDHTDIRLQGGLAGHSLSVQADGLATRDGRAGLELTGRVQDSAWRGTLRQAFLQSPQLGLWRQDEAAGLQVSAEAANLALFCLHGRGPVDGASFCLEGGWQAGDGRWQGRARLAGLPLARFQPLLPPDMELTGRLDAETSADGQGSALQHARLKASATDQRLHFLQGKAAAGDLVWKAHLLEAAYADGGLQLDWRHELDEGSTMTLRLASPKLPLDAVAIRQAPLEGQVLLNIKKLDFLDALTAQQSRWSGALNGELQLAGTVDMPQFLGHLELERGEVLVPALGLHLAPLKALIRGSEGRLSAEVEAQAREGRMRLEGGVDLGGNSLAILPLRLQGENFGILDQPGLRVVISPDIQANFTEGRIEVQGRVLVPHALVESVTFDSAVTPSQDVVVVDDPAPAPASHGALPLYADIGLILGDDVRLNTFGLRARIAGGLQVQQRPGRQPVGKGQLNIEQGSFAIYGERVRINRGRLLFSGGPLTNPGLDIRSENKERNVTAGVRVSGFLQKPRIELYSRPFMEQGDIVSHLISDTGSFAGEGRGDIGLIGDTAEKLGMGGLVPYLKDIKRFSMIDDIKLDTDKDSQALVFGSWITPDFYVSYGKSLSGDGSLFKTRYTLGSGFVVETESGETQSSGDIKYEFEH